MSRRINPTLSSPEALALAEAARIHHYSVVTSPDGLGGSMDNYKRSQRMFIRAIKIAYPHMDAKRIYMLWVDCMESISFCVNSIARHGYPF